MSVNETKLIIQIQPNAKRNEVTRFSDGILHLKITAPPIEGKANRELIAFLGEILNVSKSSIMLEKGATSKRKVLSIKGLSPVQMEKLKKTLSDLVDTVKKDTIRTGRLF